MKKRNILFAVTVAAALSVLSANPVYAEESESISKETYDQMIEVLKDQIRDGDLDTEEDVRNTEWNSHPEKKRE